MKAFQIIRHALLQVIGNFRQALMLSVMPVAGQCLLVIVGFMMLTGRHGGSVGTPLIVLMILGFAICGVWLAVRWHRFVLLDERAHPLSPPPAAAMWRYVGFALIVPLAALPLLLVTFLFMAAGVNLGLGLPAVIILVILMFLTSGLMLILGTALPGAAIGAPHPIRAAWNGMKPAAGVVFLLLIAGSVANWLGQYGFALLQRSGLPLSVYLGINLAFYWLSTLFGLSLLTTLWGHFVEGRPLR